MIGFLPLNLRSLYSNTALSSHSHLAHFHALLTRTRSSDIYIRPLEELLPLIMSDAGSGMPQQCPPMLRVSTSLHFSSLHFTSLIRVRPPFFLCTQHRHMQALSRRVARQALYGTYGVNIIIE